MRYTMVNTLYYIFIVQLVFRSLLIISRTQSIQFCFFLHLLLFRHDLQEQRKTFCSSPSNTKNTLIFPSEWVLQFQSLTTYSGLQNYQYKLSIIVHNNTTNSNNEKIRSEGILEPQLFLLIFV